MASSLLESHDVHRSKSTQWLRQHLHSESESTIFAIQDQVIATRVYEAKVMMKSVPSVMCRVCGQAEETILHLMAACPRLATSAYLYRYNLVASAIHWHLSKVFSLPLSSSPTSCRKTHWQRFCGISV